MNIFMHIRCTVGPRSPWPTDDIVQIRDFQNDVCADEAFRTYVVRVFIDSLRLTGDLLTCHCWCEICNSTFKHTFQHFIERVPIPTLNHNCCVPGCKSDSRKCIEIHKISVDVKC